MRKHKNAPRAAPDEGWSLQDFFFFVQGILPAMFTGLVETVGTVLQCSENSLSVERPKNFDDLHIGSSVCVSGVCLSVVELTEKKMAFDVVEETFRRTLLGELKPGDLVNLERSLPANGRFEGHIVQGHVEGVGRVTEIQRDSSNNNCVLFISLPEGLEKFCIAKGSIAISGISLTLASIHGTHCSVALIPHTLAHTTMGTIAVGDAVNIETDLFARILLSKTSHSSSLV